MTSLLFTIILVFALKISTVFCYRDKYEKSLFVLNYFKTKSITTGICFYCTENLFSLNKLMMSENIKFLSIDIDKDEFILEKILNKRNDKLGVILESKCNKSIGVLEFASKNKLFKKSYFWLIFRNEDFPTLSNLNSLNTWPDSEITLAEKLNSNEWKILDVYNPGQRQGGQTEIMSIGKWSENKGFNFYNTFSKLKNRKNLRELILKTSIRINRRSDIFDWATLDVKEKYSFLLINILKEMFNLTIEWNMVYDADGEDFEKTTRDLQEKRIDISGTAIQLSAENYKFFDYTVEINEIKNCFMFRHPRTVYSKRNMFISQLTNMTWFCVAISCLVSFILLKLAMCEETRWMYRHSEDISSSLLVVSVVAAVTQRDMTFSPQFLSGRTIALTVLTSMSILYQFYSSSLVFAALTEPRRTIDDMSSFLESGLDVGIEDTNLNRRWIEKSMDPKIIELYIKKIKWTESGGSQYYSLSEGLKRASMGHFAFFTEEHRSYDVITETWSERAICDLTQIMPMSNSKVTIGLQKHSEFRELFTIGLQLIRERGVLSRIQVTTFPAKPICVLTTSSTIIETELEDLYSAFIVLGAGIVVSLLVLSVEVAFEKYTIDRRFIDQMWRWTKNFLMRNQRDLK